MIRRYRRVWVVYRKELVETLRDRRTLMAMVLVPIVLYPALMIVLVEAMRKESGRRQAAVYSVGVPDQRHARWLERVLERETKESSHDEPRAPQNEPRARVEDPPRRTSGSPSAGGFGPAPLRAEQLKVQVVTDPQSMWSQVMHMGLQLGLVVDPPPDPDHLDDDANRVVQLIYQDTDPGSEFVFHRLDRILSNEADRIVRARVRRATGSESSLTPMLTHGLSTSTPSRQFAKILAMIVPFLLVTMAVTGAMYPAIDLTAGERERGTLETLAVSPVPVGHIVAGKFGVILTIAMLATGLNLASMSAMVHFTKLDTMVRQLSSAQPAERERVEKEIEARDAGAAPTPGSQRFFLELKRAQDDEASKSFGFAAHAAPLVLLAMLPFAILASGVMLAVCSFARTFKEAQNYMMPVMMAAIIPALVVSYMPTVRLEGLLQVVPVANIVILIREMFLGQARPGAIAISLGSTCFYAFCAVYVAARLYGHEAVLFTDVGNYRTMMSRRYFKPGRTPWPALSLSIIALLFPIYFYVQSSLVSPGSAARHFQFAVALSQIGVMAGVPLLLSWYLKFDLGRTFSLRSAGLRHWAGAALLALSIVPVAAMVNSLIGSIIPGLKAEGELFEEQQKLLTTGPLPLILLAFALAPGICEELLFRGLLLSGLRTKLTPMWTAVAVGIIFGVFHIYVEKIPIVSLLGILLSFICLCSGSIFPAMLVHVANNALSLAAANSEWLQQFFGLSDDVVGVLNLRAGIFIACSLAGALLVFRKRRPVGESGA